MSELIAAQNSADTIGLLFTYFVLIPALVTGCVVVAIVSARGEKRQNEQSAGSRWGHRRTGDGDGDQG
jgi:heme/copper-type cytochrome/quinol oxidase subunit 2